MCASFHSIDASTYSNLPLRTFETQHLQSAGHRTKGREIVAALKLLPKMAACDVAAEKAASVSRSAITNQIPQGPVFDESTRRDATSFGSVPMPLAPVEQLVESITALVFVEEITGGATFATHVLCEFCKYKSRATVDQPAIVSELNGHLQSKEHKHLRQHRGGLGAL